MNREIIYRTAVGFIILLLCLNFQLSYVEVCSASTTDKFYVDDNFDNSTPGWGIDHFSSIRDAIKSDNCSDGDRVIVYEGVYNEKVVVNKSIDLFGEDRANTIIDGGDSGSVILVTAANADISTFTIRNSGSNGRDAAVKVNAGNCRVVDNIIKNSINGVLVNNSDQTTVAYNSITGNNNGIFLSESDSNNINHNDIYSNSYNGIFLNVSCSSNAISNNNIYSNSKNGIYLLDLCNQNNITSNKVYSNNEIGVRIENSSSNHVYNNPSLNQNGYYGVMISGSSNIVDENTINSNDKHGVFLLADDNTIISDNTINGNNYDGIRIQNSTLDQIKSNRVTENSRYGIYINYYAVSNTIYDNYISGNSESNARDISADVNNWYTSKTAGSNIINGPYIGGNYWGDYTGTDSNNDGIGESTYDGISGSNVTDPNPLTHRLPVAITNGPYEASTGEEFTLDASTSYSPDGDIVSYSWDLGDGTTSSSESLTHSYSTAGTYTISLTVTNSYGGNDTTTTQAVITKDTTPPTIQILQNGSSYSNVHTYKVKVTDNVETKNVWIEYWYNTSEEKMTAEMENLGNNRYKKVITAPNPDYDVYCVVYANDTSGNTGNTKKPFVDLGGPYKNCTVLKNITFDGTKSYDLDGIITEYTWDFGDGTTGKGSTCKHKFFTDQKYTVTLTATDNDGNTNSASTTITVQPLSNSTPSSKMLNDLEDDFNITFDDPFKSYDTDGDGEVDSFVDPNDILKVLHPKTLEINGNNAFLLKVKEADQKVFLWDATDNKIIDVTYQEGKIKDTKGVTNDDAGTRTLSVTINKADWTYFKVKDHYPNENLTSVKRADKSAVSPSRVWRKNNEISVLDDPSTKYYLVYSYTPERILTKAEILPQSGANIGKNNQTISITYEVPVKITDAVFFSYETGTTKYIQKDLEVFNNNRTFEYTPPSNLPEGMYELNMEAQTPDGDETLQNASSYYFTPYSTPGEEEGSILELLIIAIFIGAAGGAIFLLLKNKEINLQSFIYFKNKKILPFFKPIVFGPLKFDVDSDKVNKVEFYVNGRLKETLTEEPFIWNYDETSFFKQNIETRVYDKKGNQSSTGETTYFVFNPPTFL
ncbi:MAG: NosD domain-containing protein [Candidatus Thermoplasmatota archaeon]